MSNDKVVYIYGLYDESHTVRYVGQTVNLDKRYADHFRTKSDVGHWMRVQWAMQPPVGMMVLQECPKEDADQQEVYWIKKCSSESFIFNYSHNQNQRHSAPQELAQLINMVGFTEKQIARYKLALLTEVEKYSLYREMVFKEFSDSLTKEERPLCEAIFEIQRDIEIQKATVFNDDVEDIYRNITTISENTYTKKVERLVFGFVGRLDKKAILNLFDDLMGDFDRHLQETKKAQSRLIEMRKELLDTLSIDEES